MTIEFEARLSDSPYIETVTQGRMVSAGSVIRPAESHWHMVFLKLNGTFRPIIVGALPTSGLISYNAGAEVLWVKFKLGTWLPHLPVREFLNVEMALPDASSRSFWLKGSAWQFPDYNNVETFVNRLVRQEILVKDPVVHATLQDELPEIASRTVRHRFLQTTGLSQKHIQQMHRAQHAATLLQQGVSIFDTIVETGYFDQPHLTRALKQFIGYTPAQLSRLSKSA